MVIHGRDKRNEFAFNDQFVKIDEAESYMNGVLFLALNIVTTAKLIMRSSHNRK
jgi:hypothetical protein